LKDGETDEPSVAERVWQVIALIPKGRVATYGPVALLCGTAGRCASGGTPVEVISRPDRRFPWHRVVNASGRDFIAQRISGGFARQQRLLKKERGLRSTRRGESP
jgi:methylated-DNA-protein-cysteine methyltransferase-like protein